MGSANLGMRTSAGVMRKVMPIMNKSTVNEEPQNGITPQDAHNIVKAPVSNSIHKKISKHNKYGHKLHGSSGANRILRGK